MKVLLIDNQILFREGIKAILEQSDCCEVVATCDHGRQAIEMIERGEINPTAILMNVHVENTDMVEFTQTMQKNYPDIRVIALLGELDDELIIDLLVAGCAGFLLKKHYGEKLVEAVRDVCNGEYVISGPIAEVLAKQVQTVTLNVKEMLSSRLKAAGYHFTNRELDVAELLMNKYTNQEMSEELALGEGTVKNYISEIYAKLDIHNRKEAIRYLKGLTE